MDRPATRTHRASKRKLGQQAQHDQMPTGVRETISGSRCGARVVVQRAVSGATRPPEEIFDEHPDGLAIYRMGD
jgi:hypothetical protein